MTAEGIQIPGMIRTEKDELIFERFCSAGNLTGGKNANFVEQFKDVFLQESFKVACMKKHVG